MTQEPVTEPGARVRALDEARNVGDDERPLARQADGAEVRNQGGERVIGDLWPRRGDAGDQRRLADVREAEQADVREQLELEPDGALLAGRPRFGLARGAVGRRREVDVPAPTLTA